jgi:hypothetical protein
MSDIDKIKSMLRKNMPLLKEKYHVMTLEIFGSYARGAQSETSDVDMIVEFNKTIDLFTFMELENVLTEMIGIKVDLSMKDALKPRLKEYVLKEAIPV